MDHFEEFFVHLGPLEQETFLNEFAQCVAEQPDVHWLIAIREDYVGSLQTHKYLGIP